MYQADRSIGRGVLQLRLPEWRLKAACRSVDPDLAKIVFFPEPGAPSDAHKQWCDVCPVRNECLEEGLAQEGKARVGIYGGLTQREMERERKKRKGTPQRVTYSNTKKPINHGTIEGYHQHRTRHIGLCEACQQAIDDERRAQQEKAIRGELGWHARKIEIQRRIDQERTQRARRSA